MKQEKSLAQMLRRASLPGLVCFACCLAARRAFAITLILFICIAVKAQAQTTAFTYQGRLTDASAAANGTYDLQFALYDAPTGGNPVAANQTATTGVSVSNGVFTVQLDFGSTPFASGAERYLEIRVKRPADAAYTPLAPRQRITSAPYAIRALNAATADSATNAQNAVNATNATTATTATNATNAANADKLDSIDSSGFVKNQTTQQASTDFNIGGTGKANIFDAATQFNIGGNRVFSIAGMENMFIGKNSGTFASGTNNVFVGENTGQAADNTGSGNSFIGFNAGYSNTVGGSNVFVGRNAGFSNTTGNTNSFVGLQAGFNNTTGSQNSFFGKEAGYVNTTGSKNSFFGLQAGLNNAGSGNSFFGVSAGFTNVSGSNNTIIGHAANVGANNLNYATAIGSEAVVTSSNTVVLGRSADTVQVPGNLNVAGSFTGNFTVPASNITGIVPISSGGTGSATQNFVDLTTNQTIGGGKTFTGTLSGNAVNSQTQYNIGGNRVFSIAGTENMFIGKNSGTFASGTNNVFVGENTGQAAGNTGSSNSFIGFNAGYSNTAGIDNVFVGRNTGFYNTTGSANSFVGKEAGFSNASGIRNSFFGNEAGFSNSTGNYNTFVGVKAGYYNSQGGYNSFFGYQAGYGVESLGEGISNSFFGVSAGYQNIGSRNSFFGTAAGVANVSGSDNTLIGHGANVGANNLNYATAIGAEAVASRSNSITLGRASGSDTLIVPGNTELGLDLRVGGLLAVNNLGITGSQPLCRNTANQVISLCSSSLRYKTNIAPFSSGLNFINQLRPISFDWKDSGNRDIGFGAEDVAAINPLFVIYNEKGEVEGVKYDRLSVAFVNAFREQQTQIEAQEKKNQEQQTQIEQQKTINQNLQTQIEEQRKQNRLQQRQIDELKQIVCLLKPDAAVCKK